MAKATNVTKTVMATQVGLDKETVKAILENKDSLKLLEVRTEVLMEITKLQEIAGGLRKDFDRVVDIFHKMGEFTDVAPLRKPREKSDADDPFAFLEV